MHLGHPYCPGLAMLPKCVAICASGECNPSSTTTLQKAVVAEPWWRRWHNSSTSIRGEREGFPWFPCSSGEYRLHIVTQALLRNPSPYVIHSSSCSVNEPQAHEQIPSSDVGIAQVTTKTSGPLRLKVLKHSTSCICEQLGHIEDPARCARARSAGKPPGLHYLGTRDEHLSPLRGPSGMQVDCAANFPRSNASALPASSKIAEARNKQKNDMI